MARTQAPKGTNNTSRDVPVEQGNPQVNALEENRAKHGGHPKKGEYNTRDGQPFGDPLPAEQAKAGTTAPDEPRQPNADNKPDPEGKTRESNPELPPKVER